MLLALVTASVVVGLFSTNLAYNIFLSFIHLVLVVLFQFYLLYINRTKSAREISIISSLNATNCLYNICSNTISETINIA
jgi:hypothetical protein